VYDMYPWDRPASSTGSAHAARTAPARTAPARTAPARTAPAPRAAEGAQAVQVALDRRDNGGDAAATADAAATTDAAAAAAAATAAAEGAAGAAHRPTAGPTHQ
jgi:heparin binding hemagglutinin HbhA